MRATQTQAFVWIHPRALGVNITLFALLTVHSTNRENMNFSFVTERNRYNFEFSLSHKVTRSSQVENNKPGTCPIHVLLYVYYLSIAFRAVSLIIRLSVLGAIIRLTINNKVVIISTENYSFLITVSKRERLRGKQGFNNWRVCINCALITFHYLRHYVS